MKGDGSCGSESDATGGELAPIQCEVGNEDSHEGDQDGGDCAAGDIEMIPCRYRLQDTCADKGEGEGVGADHPLAVLLDVAVARGEEGGSSGKEPRSALNGGASYEQAGSGDMFGDGHEDGERGSDEDGRDINAAEYPMELRVAAAETAGELQRAAEQGSEAAGDMRDEHPGDAMKQPFFWSGTEEGDLTVERDGDDGCAHDGPERGFLPVAARWG